MERLRALDQDELNNAVEKFCEYNEMQAAKMIHYNLASSYINRLKKAAKANEDDQLLPEGVLYNINSIIYQLLVIKVDMKDIEDNDGVAEALENNLWAKSYINSVQFEHIINSMHSTTHNPDTYEIIANAYMFIYNNEFKEATSEVASEVKSEVASEVKSEVASEVKSEAVVKNDEALTEALKEIETLKSRLNDSKKENEALKIESDNRLSDLNKIKSEIAFIKKQNAIQNNEAVLNSDEFIKTKQKLNNIEHECKMLQQENLEIKKVNASLRQIIVTDRNNINKQVNKNVDKDKIVMMQTQQIAALRNKGMSYNKLTEYMHMSKATIESRIKLAKQLGLIK